MWSGSRRSVATSLAVRCAAARAACSAAATRWRDDARPLCIAAATAERCIATSSAPGRSSSRGAPGLSPCASSSGLVAGGTAPAVAAKRPRAAGVVHAPAPVPAPETRICW
eukprot:229477-Chlamydomonas_euryale.AAC.2